MWIPALTGNQLCTCTSPDALRGSRRVLSSGCGSPNLLFLSPRINSACSLHYGCQKPWPLPWRCHTAIFLVFLFFSPFFSAAPKPGKSRREGAGWGCGWWGGVGWGGVCDRSLWNANHPPHSDLSFIMLETKTTRGRVYVSIEPQHTRVQPHLHTLVDTHTRAHTGVHHTRA